MSNSGPILAMRDLLFCYKDHAVPVLQGVTLSIAPGERVGLVGCNGVGKSTLLKLLVGILSMQQGTLEVSGLAMQRENLASIRRKVGYIFQDSDSQLFMPTVAADVAFAAQNYGYPPEEVAARTRRALQQVHIEDCADRPVYRLSGGQKKLASIAGILTLDPELILMDEPSAALDPKNRRNLIEILRSLPCATTPARGWCCCTKGALRRTGRASVFCRTAIYWPGAIWSCR